MLNFNPENNILKLIVLLLISFIFLLSLSTILLASTGCFLNLESDDYCQEITLQQVEDECDVLGGCELDSDFFFGVGCDNFEQCNAIYCQSNCDIEFYGQCPYGEIPEEDTYNWCGSGCCRLNSNEGNVCQYLETKFECMLLAESYETSMLNWDLGFSESACSSSCADSFDTEIFTLGREDFDLEKSNVENIYDNLDISSGAEKTNELNISNNNSSTFLTNFLSPENKKLLFRFGLLIVLLAFLMVCLFMLLLKNHWKHYSKHIFNREYTPEIPLSKDNFNSKSLTKLYLPNTLKYAHPKHLFKKIKNVHAKHSIRKKEAFLEENFPGNKILIKNNYLDKLKHLVTKHHRKSKKQHLKHKQSKHSHLNNVLDKELKDKSKLKKEKSYLEKLKNMVEK
ncbi:hypothetical protein HN385_06855 [archaeon]|jgi:hypothetical protein|nr:hypothetical protein [archaeon]MBT3450992.1 hypothetical protein [archaeon]MBT6868588.1 hypothetical protein [archaeon]MBT7193120.1 hypothetical protein [archaeon]MBT7380437.1 hypothetical protein [archaeon]